ncbi:MULTISPECIES: hypothetical protein [unclassified Streptomyces]|nr:hypothetical protein OIE76_12740 [Streptomyces sp. NBC_01727]
MTAQGHSPLTWQGHEESLTEYAGMRVLGRRAWSFRWDRPT